MKPKPIVFIGLAVAVLAACGSVLTLLLVRTAGTRTTPQALVWDFRKGPGNPDEVNWPASVTGDSWDLRGNFDLTIIGGSGEVVFHENVQHIICGRKGGKLTEIYLHFAAGSTSAQAYEAAKRISTRLGRQPHSLECLEKWYDAINKKVSRSAYVKVHEHDRDDCGLQFLYPSFEGDGLRLTETSGGGKPEKGNVSYTISVAFP